MANPNPNPKNRFKKGHVGVAGPGRPRGSTNVLTRDIKTLLREAAEEVVQATKASSWNQPFWPPRCAEAFFMGLNFGRAIVPDASAPLFRQLPRDNQPKKPIPPGLHGGDRRSAGARSSSQNENLKAFVADIAVKTGKGRSTVARDVTRAKKVAVLDDIAGTCLDKSICIRLTAPRWRPQGEAN